MIYPFATQPGTGVARSSRARDARHAHGIAAAVDPSDATGLVAVAIALRADEARGMERDPRDEASARGDGPFALGTPRRYRLGVARAAHGPLPPVALDGEKRDRGQRRVALDAGEMVRDPRASERTERCNSACGWIAAAASAVGWRVVGHLRGFASKKRGGRERQARGGEKGKKKKRKKKKKKREHKKKI
jgi:hypothetical protein